MKIERAAIRRGDQIYTGRSHGDIRYRMPSQGKISLDERVKDEEGFVTDDGTFVNRCDAFDIAVKACQVDKPENENTSYALQSFMIRW
jgi:hypothetical protein